VAEANELTMRVDLVCRDFVGTLTHGSLCSAAADCRSGKCSAAFGKAARCEGPCDPVAQLGCEASSECYPEQIVVEFELGPPGPIDNVYDTHATCWEPLGSYDICVSDADCPATETCRLRTNAERTELENRCVTFNEGTLEIGAPCMTSAECKTDTCFTGATNTCVAPCTDNIHCPAPTTCGYNLLLNNMGTPDTSDDLVVSFCVP